MPQHAKTERGPEERPLSDRAMNATTRKDRKRSMSDRAINAPPKNRRERTLSDKAIDSIFGKCGVYCPI